MIDVLSQRAKRRGWLRGKAVRFALTRARQLAGLREAPKYYMVVALAAVRRELARLAAELVTRRKIEIADDVFFLDLKEVRAAMDGRDVHHIVIERRQAYESEQRRRRIPRVLLSDGTEPEAQATAAQTDSRLVGTAASAGVVSGVARVVLDPVGAHIEPGEILVAPSTDPGWTRFSSRLRGL